MRTSTVLSIVIAACAAFLTAASPARAKVIYVDADATGADNGTSWADAYSNLQNALEDGQDAEIRVAQGIYKPSQSNREETFNIAGDLAIIGGYAGWGEPNPDARDVHKYPTVLSGDLAGNDAEVGAARDLIIEPSRAENSYRVVTVGYYSEETSVLEGLTITGANSGYYGGGLYINYSDAIVTDCIFINNSAAAGGAMAFNNGRVIFTRCSFIRNATGDEGNGGAVYLNGCGTCRSMYGAFIDCIFVDNYTDGYGGAIYNTSVSMATCINCLFVGNTALISGAALYDNAYNLGSYLVNCTLAGNNCTAVHIAEYGLATLSNCILWDNLCGTGTGQSAQILYQEGPWRTDYKPSVNYCCIQGWDGSFGGIGNFSADPLFVSPGSWDLDLDYTPGDYHLKPDSPCINAGDPGYVAEPTSAEIPPGYYWIQEVNPDDYVAKSSERDLEGGRRLLGGKVDMGPYEYYEHEPPALVAHWKLDEAEGSTAEDSAGDNDGILHGPQWQPYGGRLEGALLFDGENDYVNCGRDSAFDISGQITVAAWANFSSVNMEWQTVIAKGDSAWRLSTANNYRRYHFAVTGGPPWNYINGDIEVAANEWHHVCGTYDGANLRLYIDGVEDPAGPVPEPNGVTTDDYDVYIGENQERPGRYWDGLIDDVRLYNYALTPAQVFNLCKPGVLYVDADAPGANNGSSWADAFKCLQDALAAAADGTEIRVAQGSYKPDCGAGITPGDRQAAFQLLSGVTIKGGYAGLGARNPDVRDVERYQTTLSGDLAGNDTPIDNPQELGWEPTRSENSYHVVTGSGTDTTAVLDGFTLTAGHATGEFAHYAGAGMYNHKGDPTVLNCTFTGNFAGNNDGGGEGGGMLNYDSHPVLTGCTFIANAAIALDGGEGSGGGICNYQSNPTLTNCQFIGNVSGRDGGGIWNYQSSPALANCLFAGNLAREGGSGSYGGGMWSWDGSLSLTSCTFAGNVARSSHIGDAAGGMYCERLTRLTLLNSIFHGNRSGEDSQIALRYCDEASISYCNIEGGSPQAGEGNLDVVPRFADPGSWDTSGTPDDPRDDLWVDGDYHLKSQAGRWNANEGRWTIDDVTSPCIDAGDPLGPIGLEPFPNGGIVNMGAYGGTAEASKSYFGKPPCELIVAGDINGDCKINFEDFRLMALHWLEDINQ